MKAPAAIANECDAALQDFLVKFQRLARFDLDRAAQEAMTVQQMMHEYLMMEGAVDA